MKVRKSLILILIMILIMISIMISVFIWILILESDELRTPTVIVDPSAAVGVDVGDHLVDVLLRHVVAEVLQDPAQLADVHLTLLLLVEDAEHLLQLALVFVLL